VESILSQSLVSGVLSIEAMLERQLFAAIGREVTVEDVTEYMKLRGQQLFRAKFRPSPMTYAVRRSASHSPEGTLSLERNIQHNHLSSRSSSLPSSSPLLHTVVRREVMELPSILGSNFSADSSLVSGNLVGPMSFALSDASRVTMTGERYLHSYLHHQFGTESSSPSMTLSIRAHQFSSFNSSAAHPPVAVTDATHLPLHAMMTCMCLFSHFCPPFLTYCLASFPSPRLVSIPKKKMLQRSVLCQYQQGLFE
jgi:hypothetical protein